jgi:hypothetical protein
MRQPTLAWNNFPPYRRAVQIIRSIAPALTAAAGLLLVGPLAGSDAAAHAIEGIQSAASNSARQPVGGGSAREVAQARTAGGRAPETISRAYGANAVVHRFDEVAPPDET